MEQLREAARLASVAAKGHYAMHWIKSDLVHFRNCRSQRLRQQYVDRFYGDTDLVLRDVRMPA